MGPCCSSGVLLSPGSARGPAHEDSGSELSRSTVVLSEADAASAPVSRKVSDHNEADDWQLL